MLDASRAAFWNVVVLPTLAVLNLAFAVILRRSFGLYSGVYDVLLGVLATLLLWSTFGIPSSLTKFLPELDGAWSRAGIARFLRRVILVRFALLVAVLVPLNLFSDWLAEVLSLGAEGPALLRLLSALVVLRAGLELIAKILNSYFAQLWTNLILLGQSLLDFLLVGAILFAGYQMRAVIGALLVSSAVSVVWGADRVRRMLGGKRRAGDEAEVTPEPIDELFDTERPRFIRFATFTYTYELTVYLVGMGFVGPALAIVLDSEQVALFATAFKLTLTTVSLVVVGFRGVYRPFFVRLRMAGDAEQLRRGFAVVSKAQLVLLLPTGVGLAVLSGDLIPLLFGSEFLPAVPVARVLITLLFVETAFNLGNIVLAIDERFRAVLGAKSLLVVGAPLFLATAVYGGLTWAAVVFGSVRVAAAVLGYWLARRRYGFAFPWAFLVKVGSIAGVMGAVVGALSAQWPTSLPQVIALVVVGVALFALGLRVARVLGPDEIQLVERTRLPGSRWLVAWCNAGR